MAKETTAAGKALDGAAVVADALPRKLSWEGPVAKFFALSHLGGQTCNNYRATSICPVLFSIFSSLLFSLSENPLF